MQVQIASTLLMELLEAAALSPDQEICGVLLGSPDVIESAAPATNIAVDPATTFEIDPAVLFKCHRAARSGGHQIIGYYHSHPSGAPEPSRCDAERADEMGAYWLIMTPDKLYGLFQTVAQGPIHDRFTRCVLVAG
ncbi:Mov34/MPN/PAD-1 family protein [Aquisediminimonas sediminicola]|uniref:Mov34/MPN/PAD-1 family protein n=1 Tax=Alteraquisediminimonas sediminicola TaxID=2676787 RepID=UPI001C8D7A15|nr:M67 family metallopeptidase [Aquisediminimonas sediminicola]